MNLQEWEESDSDPRLVVNENFETLDWSACYGRNPNTTTGLTWGYFGGRWGGFSVAAGTLALTASQTNYIVANRSSGALSTSTSNTNWNDTTTYARVYKVVTGGSTVTSYEDHRGGPDGVHGQRSATGSTQGKHAIYISAAAMRPSVSGGCAAVAAIASAANQPDIVTLDFDASTEEYAQFSMVMPKKWDEGTITFKAHWSHAATTTNFGVAWKLQAVAVSDDDAIAVAFGTAVAVTDTGGTTNDLYTSAESSAVTVAGTPAAEDMVFCRVFREPSNGSDNMAIDARLHGITVYVTTNADTDA